MLQTPDRRVLLDKICTAYNSISITYKHYICTIVTCIYIKRSVNDKIHRSRVSFNAQINHVRLQINPISRSNMNIPSELNTKESFLYFFISLHFCSIHQLLKFFDPLVESILISGEPALGAFQSLTLLQQNSTFFAELFRL